MNKIIRDVCGKFKIELVDIRDDEENIIRQSTGDREDWVENCFIYGSDKIIMGYYDNEDRRLASIFHEIGHALMHQPENTFEGWPENMKTLHWEIMCWNVGIKYAWTEYGIIFLEDTIKWAYEKALTYYRYA